MTYRERREAKAARLQEWADKREAAASRQLTSQPELQERIEALKAKRDAAKVANTAYRKAHATELKALTAYGRSEAVPFPSYWISNIGADIRRNEQRLAQLTAAADGSRPLRIIQAHRAGDCERCGQPISEGDWIGKYADGWSHISGTPWTRCAS